MTKQNIEIYSKRIVSHAENAIEETLTTLSDIEAINITVCDRPSINVLGHAVDDIYSIHDIILLGPLGNVLCNQRGEVATFKTMGNAIYNPNPKINFQVSRTSKETKAGLWAKLKRDNNRSLAAFIPDRVLLGDILPNDVRMKGIALLLLDDGTMIGAATPFHIMDSNTEFGSDTISITTVSEHYPIKSVIMIPFQATLSNFSELRRWGMVGGILVGLIIMGLSINLIRGAPEPVSDIVSGIEREEFIPYYQPVINLKTGQLDGCEVLVRWAKEDGSLVSPGAFISVAESTGLGLDMTRLIMRTVRSDLEESYAKRPELKAAINLFHEHFKDLEIVSDVKAIFSGGGVSFSQLVFEVTERYPLADMARAKEVICALQELGAKVALDDAGTGHGGLAYLQELGLDILKIDKLFIDAIGHNETAAPIVSSLVDLAGSLEMDLIAEGVETFEQVEYLRSIGVIKAQGFIFAPPLNARNFLELVERMTPLNTQPNIDEEAGQGILNKASA